MKCVLQSPCTFNFKAANLHEQWTWWKQTFDPFLKTSGKDATTDARNIAILLNCIGIEDLRLYNTFNLKTKTGSDSSVTELKYNSAEHISKV